MDRGQSSCRWTKRKQQYSMSSNILVGPTNYYGATQYPSSSYDIDGSWEEQAFAEDAAGAAGSVWPPRSYSCSFCGREFRSAQALGGHMNVHRRDRARLKQQQPPSSPQNDPVDVKNPLASLGFLSYQSPLCGLGPETNPNYDPARDLLARYSSKSPRGLDSGDGGVSMNLYVCRNQPPAVQFETGQEEADMSFKKRKTDASSIPLLLFPRPSSVDQHDAESQVFELSPSFAHEELDLELRLGYRSKV